MRENKEIGGGIEQLRRPINLLYLLFNWACILVYGYQVLLWVSKGVWTKLPTKILFGPTGWQPCTASTPVGKAFCWLVDVELAYTLCVLAMVFYLLRWLANRRPRDGLSDV